MPNWCSNTLVVKGSKEELNKMYDKIMVKGELDFNAIIPMPAHQPDTDKPNAFFADGNLGPEERKKFGSNNWYDWSNDNWGTKWNASDSYGTRPYAEGNPAEISFSTAWSPVADLVDTLSTQFPSLTFEYSYSEEGMMFAANLIIKNGEWLEEEYLDEDDMVISKYLEDPSYSLKYPDDFIGYADVFEEKGYTEMAEAIRQSEKEED
jgi:hypothetical protein